MNAKEIYQKVIEAMQNAEEIGGPEGLQYIALMTMIAKEANQRAADALGAASLIA